LKGDPVGPRTSAVSEIHTRASAWAAAPFGSFGGIVGGGNSGAGLLPLHGWALDDNGVQAVDILVDGVLAGRASYGRARAGVTAKFPGFPDSALPGFAFELDTTRYLNGRHTVVARVKSKAGETVNLQSRTFQFSNVEHGLLPFGRIEFPGPQAELRGKCEDLADPNRRFSVVSGYALDAGTTNDDHGVAYVELLIDRAVRANTQTDCFFSTVTGGLTDCYGLRRIDIERIFPSLKDSPHSGFRFVLDIGFLMATGYTPGSHVITVRAGDHANQVRNIAEIPVTFSCDEDGANENSFGAIDQPGNGLLHHGVIPVSGWALDWEGINAVQILVDGRVAGFATLGFPRPEVSSLHLGFPESAAPGWRFNLDTTAYSNGEHFIDVIVRDDTGAEIFIGKRRIVINNVGG
jgi:N-acetylmuramoyl-L-alanine amidase